VPLGLRRATVDFFGTDVEVDFLEVLVLRDGGDVERVERLNDVEREAEQCPPFCAVRLKATEALQRRSQKVALSSPSAFDDTLPRQCLFESLGAT